MTNPVPAAATKPLVAGVLTIIAGACIALALPPPGWWPLAIVGIALWDWLIAHQPWRQRCMRGWLVGASWLFPSMVWMWDLTIPGYLIAAGLASTLFAAASAISPPGASRLWVFPGLVAVFEFVRWSWPFGGVPLAHLALTQAASPLGATARIGGPLLVVVLVVVLGQSVASVAQRHFKAAGVGVAVVVGMVALAWVAPRASTSDEISVALVQGGGPQRTRASAKQNPVVLARHVEASRWVDTPVDLVVWPENVVNPGNLLHHDDARALVNQVAADLDAPVLAGWFYRSEQDGEIVGTVNYHSTITPSGDEVSRYDKVILVPFGEFVPLRGLIEFFNDEIPAFDVLPSNDTPVLDTPLGLVGVSISWEGFFESRARDATNAGAVILTNPTNGASYWLTQVQSQQLASNQLRAIENDRWVLQVAPTGFSAVINPDGAVAAKTSISERSVLTETAQLREGRTLATLLGPWPIVIYGMAAIVTDRGLTRRRQTQQPN